VTDTEASQGSSTELEKEYADLYGFFAARADDVTAVGSGLD